MASSTLQTIQQKVRRLTRSLDVNLLTDNALNQYIDTFVLYDLPEHLRLFNLHTTFTFFTEPYIDTYETSSTASNPLFDFKNKYITVNPPIYIAGYQALFVESRDQFYGIYPQLNLISSIGTTGNGVTTQFSGVINTNNANSVTQNILLLRNNVLFSSIDTNSNGLSMIDYPISASIGNLYVPGGSPTSTAVQDPNNYINYLTGQYVVTFVTAPGSGEAINSQTIQLQPSIPQTMLFYDGKFTLRPVPDQPYRVQMEVYTRPSTYLDSSGDPLSLSQEPDLKEWWQYIAIGASIKVFQDRMDMESVSMIIPEFKKQENLILRRTIVQQTSQRTPTIYTQDNGAAGSYGPGWWSSGGTF